MDQKILPFHKLKYIIVGLLLFITDAAKAQEQYYPDEVWETRSAKEAKVKDDALKEAVDFAKANEYSGSKDLRLAILKGFEREPYHRIAGPVKKRGAAAGMIIKNGYIIAEWGDTKRVDMTFSVTKSYLSTMAGLAVENKLIKDTKDPLNEYIWDGKFEGDHNSKITWDHLLTQSSDWSGSLFGMHDWADRPPKEGGIDDWKNRDYFEPGENFEYNDVRVNLLSYSLLQVWRKPLPQVLKENIMDPIGASPIWRWFGYDSSWVTVDGISMQSVSGGGHSGGGIFINTRDHARFGLLFLRNGKWKGKSLISENWIKISREPSKANESYGYMWWLNTNEIKIPGASDDIFYAAGFGGNYIIIDQENDLLIVTRWLEPSKMAEFVGKVLGSIK